MSSVENRALAELQRDASPHGIRLFRNQVGSYKLADGRWLTSGLGEGSSDSIGWTPLLVQPHHVGQLLAVFTSIELKSPGARTERKRLEAQTAWLRAVQAAGGIGFFANDPQAALRLLRQLQGS